MIGVNQITGQKIDGINELTQRIANCLNTRLGSMPSPHRGFGSDLPKLVDSKLTENLKLECYVAVADALANVENGFTQSFKLIRSSIEFIDNTVALTVLGQWLVNGETIKLRGITLR